MFQGLTDIVIKVKLYANYYLLQRAKLIQYHIRHVIIWNQAMHLEGWVLPHNTII